MRILLAKKDLPLLKKAVKIIRKESLSKIKQSETLDGISTALGYIDYKQLNRLAILNDVTTDSPISIESIHEQITPWLENVIDPTNLNGNYFKASILIEKLNLKSLSVLNNKRPFKLIFDEYFNYSQSMFAREKELEVLLLRKMGIPTYHWYALEPSKNPADKNIVLLETLIDKTSLLLQDPIFRDISAHYHEDMSLFEAFKNKVLYEALPESMISAMDLLSSKAIKSFNPLGFTIVEGILNNKEVFSLYNDNLGAYLPAVYPEIYSARYALAQLASSGDIDIEAFQEKRGKDKDHNLNGDAYFQGNKALLKVKDGVMKENDFNQFLWTNNKYLGKLIIGTEFNDLSIYEHGIYDLNLPFDPDTSKEFLNIYNIPSFDNEMAYPNIMKGNQEALINYCLLLGGINKYSREYLLDNDSAYDKAIDYIESKTIDNHDIDDYIHADSVEELRKAFPKLLKRFSLQQVDTWHENMTMDSGYRSNGNLHFNESNMISDIYHETLFAEVKINLKKKHHNDVSLVLLDQGFSNNEIASMLEKINMCQKAFDSDMSIINSASYEFNKIGEDNNVVSNGDEKTLLSEMMRSGRKHNIMVTQHISDFDGSYMHGELKKLSSEFLDIKMHQTEQSDLRRLPPAYQIVLKEIFDENNLDFSYDIVSSKSILSEDKLFATKKYVGKGLNEVIKRIKDVSKFRMNDIIEWLAANDNLITYLDEKPLYFVCIKTIDSRTFCYVSIYNDDCDYTVADFENAKDAINYKDNYIAKESYSQSGIGGSERKLLDSLLDKHHFAFGKIGYKSKVFALENNSI